VRMKVQEFIQSLLEEEITELLGRKKSERRKALDSAPAYRNGHGKGRRLTLGCGTITLYRPRGTSTSPSGVCWGKKPPSQPAQWPGSRSSGKLNGRNGESASWANWR